MKAKLVVVEVFNEWCNIGSEANIQTTHKVQTRYKTQDNYTYSYEHKK